MTILYFAETCVRLRLSELEAFETAYVHVFGKQGHVTPDYVAYIQHGILSKYVVSWLKLIQKEECNAHPLHQVRQDRPVHGEDSHVSLDASSEAKRDA